MSPYEIPVLGNARRHDETLKTLAGGTHISTITAKSPPVLATAAIIIFFSFWLHMFEHVCERLLEQSCIFKAHIDAEIDDPSVRWSLRYVLSVGPRLQNIAAGQAIRIGQ